MSTHFFRPSRRAVLAYSGVFTASSLLAACGSSGSGSSSSSDANSIEMWARGGATTADAYAEIVPTLEQATGITVNFSTVDNFGQELQSRAQSKNLPDLWINDDVLLGTYQRQGLLREIVLDDYAEASDIDDARWAETQIDGGAYAVPYSRQTMVNCFRSDWLETLGLSVPTTWEEYVAFLDAVVSQDPDGDGSANTYGTNVAGTAKNGYLARWAMSYIWQSGGSLWTDNGDGTFSVDTTSKETVSAVQWIQDLFAVGGRVQPGALTADTSVSTPFFAEGKVGHTLTGPYQFSAMDEAPGKDLYVVAPAPAGPHDSTVLAEGENIYVSAGTEKLEAVNKVISWFISEEGQTTCMTNSKQPVVRVPVRSDMDAATIYDDERWGVVQNSLADSSQVFPAVADASAIKQVIAESLNTIVSSPEQDPTAELENLKAELEGVFDELGLL
ncbi:ABC transporter substrate-binding protein [Actinomyces ruminis]|uniref:ABC transporter substrate-binding protein n=1 Tax=Actinomyces ruminis TaxID=1937003 RepID=A0ABX4ME56_9ACTO|nr:extracellular solute-binding protein [Actinomyces ruminis]PHP53765.1 ABC transporter substrate-binding protein [Actinomyces ruminis]